MEPSGSNLGQAGQCHFRLLFEECCKQEVEKGRGGRGGVVGRHYYIMLQRNTEPEKVRSTRIDQLFYFSLSGLFVLQVTSCDR